ncbi:hypothetical protein J0910_13530 [Nocardiopsis sp. CNT-189]|uniref:DEAD/DEAH box helicase n=1 Tax=Nocardiopsis oceanisediminis TaxID=2816862 RepID=UPI003B353840
MNGSPSENPPVPDDLREVAALIGHFFCDPETAIGHYATPADRPVTEKCHTIIPGVLYRCPLVDSRKQPVTLHLYRGVGRLGGNLWERQVRVLLRAASYGHPALPEILEGGHRDDEYVRGQGIGTEGFAYVVTRRHGHALTAFWDDLRGDPPSSLRQFLVLADGLQELHGQRMVHRSISRGSIGAVLSDAPDSGTGQIGLQLTRFEMSTLTNDLLRFAVAEHDRDPAQILRELHGADLYYCAPEMLEFLDLGLQRIPQVGEWSDVYSLGLVAAGLLAEDAPAPPADAGPPGRDEVLTWQHRVVQSVRDSRRLPKALKDLLAAMLHGHTRSRPSSGQVVGRLRKKFDEIMWYWDDPAKDERPHLLIYAPSEYRDTLLAWGEIRHDPVETQEGAKELADRIEADLRGARLYHAPSGAAPYMASRTAQQLRDKEKSEYLLFGRRMAWFCREFRPRQGLSGYGDPYPDVLIIKYVVNLQAAPGRRLREALIGKESAPSTGKELSREIGSVEALPLTVDPEELEHQRTGRPVWSRLLDSIKISAGKSQAYREFEEAMKWLLQYQRIEFQARHYPYIAEGTGDRTVLRLDEERDRKVRYDDALTAHYYGTPRLRPGMGDFFDSVAGGGEHRRVVEVLPDSGGRPGRDPVKVDFVERGGEDGITVRQGPHRPRIPERGWVRPENETGSEIALRRQSDALPTLLDNRMLVGQLLNPTTIRGLVHPWKKEAGSGLIGGVIATEMLVCEPFFALHGPPGTGKTRVSAQAIAAYLRNNPGRRVLVSAQSNYALDNLAAVLLERLDLLGGDGAEERAGEDESGRVIALRLATHGHEDRVDPRLRDRFVPEQLAQRRVELLHGLMPQRARAEEVRRKPRLAELLAEWPSVVEHDEMELVDRVRRSANLVFATCSAAGRTADATGRGGDLFDWVVIEEAAKAWPTELVIPLTQGIRWTLIGDHKQLPAHRRSDVERFLAGCAESDDEELSEHARRGEQYMRAFNLFGSLFSKVDPSASPALERVEQLQGAADPPVRHLSTQFRMNRAIGDLVSDVFYTDPRSTDPAPGRGGLVRNGLPDEPHGLAEPSWLQGLSLLWLDTADAADCADEPSWYNRGEAEVVARFIEALRPHPLHGDPEEAAERLAVLSPYRKQLDILRGKDRLAPFAHTVHSFQGREADIVVISLVRDRERGSWERPWLNIGHLTQPELVNVMCSRARRLLVMVGDHGFFAKNEGGFWPRVCRRFEEDGRVVTARALV